MKTQKLDQYPYVLRYMDSDLAAILVGFEFSLPFRFAFFVVLCPMRNRKIYAYCGLCWSFGGTSCNLRGVVKWPSVGARFQLRLRNQ